MKMNDENLLKEGVLWGTEFEGGRSILFEDLLECNCGDEI